VADAADADALRAPRRAPHRVRAGGPATAHAESGGLTDARRTRAGTDRAQRGPDHLDD
jgi:hypothetical protein